LPVTWSMRRATAVPSDGSGLVGSGARLARAGGGEGAPRVLSTVRVERRVARSEA
jgi:hypothetical protein